MKERASWNCAPWAKTAARLARRDTSTSFTEIVDALRALASDRDADPEERAKAEEMLKVISVDQGETSARRDAASRAIARINAKRQLDARMGLPWSEKAVRNEGRHQVFPALGLGARK